MQEDSFGFTRWLSRIMKTKTKCKLNNADFSSATIQTITKIKLEIY